MVAYQPCNLDTGIRQFGQFAEKAYEASRHDITVFIPIVQHITHQIHRFGSIFYRIQKTHYAHLLIARRLKISGTKMQI